MFINTALIAAAFPLDTWKWAGLTPPHFSFCWTTSLEQRAHDAAVKDKLQTRCHFLSSCRDLTFTGCAGGSALTNHECKSPSNPKSCCQPDSSCLLCFCGLILEETCLAGKNEPFLPKQLDQLSALISGCQKIEEQMCQLLFKSSRNMQEWWARLSKHQPDVTTWEFWFLNAKWLKVVNSWTLLLCPLT